MNEKLSKLLVAVGAVAASGVVVYTFAPTKQPTMWAALQDAGVTNDCTPRIAVTREAAGPLLRNKLDAGMRRHLRLYRQAFKCPLADGGAALIVPGWRRFGTPTEVFISDDSEDTQVELGEVARDLPCAAQPGFCGNGPLHVEVAPTTEQRPCLRRKLDGGACTRLDGGDQGVWNVLPRGQLTGAGCEPVECTVFAGEDPTTVL